MSVSGFGNAPRAKLAGTATAISTSTNLTCHRETHPESTRMYLPPSADDARIINLLSCSSSRYRVANYVP